jgi:hypothetical protein
MLPWSELVKGVKELVEGPIGEFLVDPKKPK